MDLSSYINVGITLACLGVGFILKYSITKLDNKYIPLIVFVIGVTLSFIGSGFTLEAFNTGWISGLASTGMYELVTNLMKQKEETTTE